MPQPSNTGNGLMGYPTTVDNGQVTSFALYSDDVSLATTATAITAGAAYLSSIVVYAPAIVTQMRCNFSGSPTGNIDMGIYDASGTNNAPNNLLGHTGAIAATTGLFTQNLTTNLLLSPGRYWIAFLDTVADSPYVRSAQVTGAVVNVRTSATNLTVLPTSLGAVSDNVNRVGVIALISGSWS